ncbi:hypothetical protein BDR06DRAFT_1007278 [Suillus hirtellus]|nr:hypothetical protein BDR06DRAFT_1007278 [Suillus hirtellus]
MLWMNSGSNKKSKLEVTRLIKEVMLAEDFDAKHLENFSVRGSLRKLDNIHSGSKVEFPDDWNHTTITIKIPTKSKEEDERLFSVPGFHFHPLIDIIQSTVTLGPTLGGNKCLFILVSRVFLDCTQSDGLPFLGPILHSICPCPSMSVEFRWCVFISIRVD